MEQLQLMLRTAIEYM